MRAVLVSLTLLAGGCDAVFGLSGDPGPCNTASFATATTADITPAESFSISRDASRVVLQLNGEPYELALPGGEPKLIDLGLYPISSFALAPEGDSLFYTAAIEPPQLFGALRLADSWNLAATVPRGTYVGTPSTAEYGPRRMIARLRDAQSSIQEYEDDGGVWTPHGELQTFAGSTAPNLTPNGLTMVYAGFDEATGDHPVMLATRGSLDEWFGEPVAILPGNHSSPQLLDACRALYVIDDYEVLRRYDRP